MGFAVFRDLKQYFIGFSMTGDGTQRYFKYLIFSIGTMAQCASSRTAVFSDHVFAELEMQQCPELAVAFYNDVAAPSAISAIGPSLCGVLVAMQVCRTGAAMP